MFVSPRLFFWMDICCWYIASGLCVHPSPNLADLVQSCFSVRESTGIWLILWKTETTSIFIRYFSVLWLNMPELTIRLVLLLDIMQTRHVFWAERHAQTRKELHFFFRTWSLSSFFYRKSWSSDGTFQREPCLQTAACSGFAGALSLSERQSVAPVSCAMKVQQQESRAVTLMPCVVLGRRGGWEGRTEQDMMCNTHELSHQMFSADSEWLMCCMLFYDIYASERSIIWVISMWTIANKTHSSHAV